MESGKSDKKSCSLDDRTYSHDAEVCESGKCMICKDGEWVETEDLFPPKESGIFSP